MLRGDVELATAVVLGDGPHAAALRSALADAAFCGRVADSGALAQADLVIIDDEDPAGPLRRTLAEVSSGALVTELSPVKSALLQELEDEVPPGYGFVSSSVFPGAGGGLEGATVALMPVMGSVPEAIERMRRLWEQLGAAVVLQLDPQVHDLWVAADQLSAQVDALVARSAGQRPTGGPPRGALSDKAQAHNGPFLAWLLDELRAGA